MTYFKAFLLYIFIMLGMYLAVTTFAWLLSTGLSFKDCATAPPQVAGVVLLYWWPPIIAMMDLEKKGYFD